MKPGDLVMMTVGVMQATGDKIDAAIILVLKDGQWMVSSMLEPEHRDGAIDAAVRLSLKLRSEKVAGVSDGENETSFASKLEG